VPIIREAMLVASKVFAEFRAEKSQNADPSGSE
jgi:hypothetical protein